MSHQPLKLNDLVVYSRPAQYPSGFNPAYDDTTPTEVRDGRTGFLTGLFGSSVRYPGNFLVTFEGMPEPVLVPPCLVTSTAVESLVA